MKKVIFLISLFLFAELGSLYALPPCDVGDIEVSFSPNVSAKTMTVSFGEFCSLDNVFTGPDPFYSVFIEWGDGMHETKEVDAGDGWELAEITHTYLPSSSESLTFDVSVSITPVKSDDNKPAMHKTSMTISEATGDAPPVTDYVSDDDEIYVFSDWNGGVDKGDTITVGIVVNDELVFENPSLGKGGATIGQIQLYYNSSYVTPLNPRVDAATDLFGRTHPLYFNTSRPEEIEGASVNPFTPGDDPFLLSTNSAYNAKLVWDYTRQSDREIVLYVDFEVKEDAALDENSYIYFLGFVRNTSSDPDLNSLMDLNEDGAADPDPLGILASDVHSLKVTPSRDPNGLTILSERIINDDQSTTLVFQLDFFNEGTGSENDIDIYFNYPAELDISTYQAVEYILKKERLIPNAGTPLLQVYDDALINNVPVIKFSFKEAKLLGLGAGLIDPRDSEGRIIFKMKTRTPPDCEEISATATIKFSGDPDFTTPPAVVKCVDCEGKTNYVYWCLVFILALVVFLLAVWLVTLKMKQNSTT